MAAMVDTHAQWSSSWVFVLAASGAAIGLSNVWQFPFLVSDYGGGAFIIVYIFCVLLIGAPLLIAEVMLGRRGRASPVNSIRRLAEQAGQRPAWGAIGWLGMGAGFLILSYLSVIAGWIMAYAARAAIGTLDGLTTEGMGNLFTTFVADPEKQMLWHTLFIVMTMFVVGRGVKAGLEPVIKYSVPLIVCVIDRPAHLCCHYGRSWTSRRAAPLSRFHQAHTARNARRSRARLLQLGAGGRRNADLWGIPAR